MMHSNVRPILILLLLGAMLALTACRPGRRSRAGRSLMAAPRTAASNPTSAQAPASGPDIPLSPDDLARLEPAMPCSAPSQRLERLAYVTSYNRDTKCPNWVAWQLTADHVDGPYPRKGIPYYDDRGTAIGIGSVTCETLCGGYFVDLEAGPPRQQLDDWPGNEYGMTHGHLCPAGDNKWSKAAMNQSFLLTNMCPQTAHLNSGGWNELEKKCRMWAQRFGSIYIVAGPLYTSGCVTRTIGQSRVAVPDAFFKVVLRTDPTPMAIGFVYRNDDSSQKMADCACPVDDVERLTGYDFFRALPDDVEAAVEASCDWAQWR